ncbi:hypothetical protein D3C71_2022510 [compost metagenome]
MLVGPQGGRFEVDKTTGRHGAGGGLQRGLVQAPFKRRVQQDQIKAGRRRLLQGRYAVAALHPHRSGLEPLLQGVQLNH